MKYVFLLFLVSACTAGPSIESVAIEAAKAGCEADPVKSYLGNEIIGYKVMCPCKTKP